MNITTDKQARGALDNGRHQAGENLWLVVRGASRSWVLRTGGRDYSIGSIKKVSLVNARAQAAKITAQLRDGINPTDEKRTAREAEAHRKTFHQTSSEVIKARQASWRGSTMAQWIKDMTIVCAPLANRYVNEISVDDVKAIIAPYWDQGRFDTARMLLNRIKIVFDYAYAHKWRSEKANPASWEVFEHLFPKAPRRNATHYVALPWTDVPEFAECLRKSAAVGARLLEFIILTASRSCEARGARWSEIDQEARLWHIPAERMKMFKIHSVPLSEAAMELLERMPRAGEFVFPGGRADKPMTNASLWALVQRHADADATTHGFRSAFKDWANNQGFDHQLSEYALAHVPEGGKIVTAYARDTLTERRRPMMEAWGRFVSVTSAPKLDNVVRFPAA